MLADREIPAAYRSRNLSTDDANIPQIGWDETKPAWVPLAVVDSEPEYRGSTYLRLGRYAVSKTMHALGYGRASGGPNLPYGERYGKSYSLQSTLARHHFFPSSTNSSNLK